VNAQRLFVVMICETIFKISAKGERFMSVYASFIAFGVAQVAKQLKQWRIAKFRVTGPP
jgi:hypothetical protein